jgi:hypothetical protein
VVGGALMLSAAFGVFNFMAGWSLPLVFLFFFLLWALVYEAYGAAAFFLLKRFFDGFRCRLRPPAVCILYKPKEYLSQEAPVLGGALCFRVSSSRRRLSSTRKAGNTNYNT